MRFCRFGYVFYFITIITIIATATTAFVISFAVLIQNQSPFFSLLCSFFSDWFIVIFQCHCCRMIWNHLLDRFRISVRYDHFRFGIKMYTHTHNAHTHLTFSFDLRAKRFVSPLAIVCALFIFHQCSLYRLFTRVFLRLFRLCPDRFFFSGLFFILYHNRALHSI